MRKVRHDWDGKPPRRPRYFATLACDTSTPSFCNSPWRSPKRIRVAHLPNQGAEVKCERRPTDGAGSILPAPIDGERATMPTHHAGGRDDLHRLPPVRPDAREQHPESPVDRTKARLFGGGSLQHGELMPERENFRRELEPRVGRGSTRSQYGDEGSHLACERYQSLTRNRNGHNT